MVGQVQPIQKEANSVCDDVQADIFEMNLIEFRVNVNVHACVSLLLALTGVDDEVVMEDLSSLHVHFVPLAILFLVRPLPCHVDGREWVGDHVAGDFVVIVVNDDDNFCQP